MGYARQIGQSLRHCLRRLLSMAGRDSPTHFWPFAMIVMLLGGTLMFAVMMPTIGKSMVAMQQMARENPDDFVVNQSTSSYTITYVGGDSEVIARMMPDVSTMLVPLGLAMLVPIALIATASARRLHDRNISGKWLTIPIILLIVAMAVVPDVFDAVREDIEPDMRLFAAGFAINLAYLASIAIFLILFALPSTPGENRYGPPPPILT